MHLIRPDLQLAGSAGGADVRGQGAGIGLQHLGATGLDQGGRHPAATHDVEGEPMMVEIHSSAIQADQLGGIGGTDRRIVAQCLAGAGQCEGEVVERGEQCQRGRMRDAGLQQHVDREVTARGIAGDHHAFGVQLALGSQPVPAGAHIVGGGGEAVSGCEPVVHAEHRETGQPGQPGGESAVGAW